MNVSRVNIKPGHPEVILGFKDKDEDSKSLCWAQRTWSSALLVPDRTSVQTVVLEASPSRYSLLFLKINTSETLFCWIQKTYDGSVRVIRIIDNYWLTSW